MHKNLLNLHDSRNNERLQSALDKLIKHIDNQQNFATAVRNILTALDNNSDYEEGEDSENQDEDRSDDNNRDNEQSTDDNASQSEIEETTAVNKLIQKPKYITDEIEDGDDNDSEFEGDGETEETPSSNINHNAGLFDYSPNYKAYTTEFDKVKKG